MATALIGLGSNLGDRAAALENAVMLLKAEPRIRVEAVSSFRPSKPAGGPEGQGEFINGAARLETSLSPEELLARLLAIEDQIGRVREKRWGPRVIDLDLLLYDRVELKTTTLELPHPRMCYRRFVLEPAAEIAGEMVWPVNGWSVGRLLENLDTTAKYIAVTCNSDDFEQIIGPINQHTACRVIRGKSYKDALLEVLAKNANSPPENWREIVNDLECREKAEAIAFKTWPHDGRWTLSDYWAESDFDFAGKRIEEIGSDCSAEFLGKLEDYRYLAQRPRLMVHLDGRYSHCLRTEPAGVDHLRQESSPPSLWLSMTEPQRAIHEVLAAMQAME